MGWQVELVGEALDIATIAELTQWPALADLAIVDGPDNRSWLGGPRIAASNTAEDARAIAARALDTLNGLARFEHANHHPVELGGASAFLHADGRIDRAMLLQGAEIRLRGGTVGTKVTRADGSEEAVAVRGRPPPAQQMANDPRLVEIVDVLAGEITWQRLRVALEKLTALIGKSGNDTQALWQKGYAERGEVERFKANIEDPRHSGNDAVHGVSAGPLRGTKLTIEEGFSFMVFLLQAYLASN